MGSASKLIDGDYSRPTPIGSPRLEYPFRQNGDRVTALFEQDFWQTQATFTPSEYPIPHETLAGFYLIFETKPVSIIADLFVFTRTYARVPAQQVVYTTVSLTEPDVAKVSSAIATNFQQYNGGGSTANLGANYVYNGYAWALASNRVYGSLAGTSSVNSGGNTRITWAGHGLAGTERIAVGSGPAGTMYLVEPANYSIIDANTVDVIGINLTNALVSSGRFLRSYTPGLTRIGGRQISNFYLPGITAGITTAADIPVPAPLLTDTAFLAAAVANLTGYVTYDSRDLVQWRGSAIYIVDTIQINIASL